MNIKPEDQFYYLSKAKYWNLYETYLLVSSHFVVLKLQTAITSNERIVATDLDAVKRYNKAKSDLADLFMEAVVSKKLKCVRREPNLLEGEFDIARDLYVERRSFLKWYKQNKKAMRKILSKGEAEDFLWKRSEALFKKVETSLSGQGEEVKEFMAGISKKGGKQLTRCWGIQLAVELILKENPKFTERQVWFQLEQFYLGNALKIENYEIFVDEQTIYQDEIITPDNIKSKRIKKGSFYRYFLRAKKQKK